MSAKVTRKVWKLFPVHVVVFALGKNGYDFFKVEFPTGDMTV